VISFGQTRTVFLATGEKDFVEGMRYYELINVHSLLEFYYNCNKKKKKDVIKGKLKRWLVVQGRPG
jgi:hypothetical protein